MPQLGYRCWGPAYHMPPIVLSMLGPCLPHAANMVADAEALLTTCHQYGCVCRGPTYRCTWALCLARLLGCRWRICHPRPSGSSAGTWTWPLCCGIWASHGRSGGSAESTSPLHTSIPYTLHLRCTQVYRIRHIFAANEYASYCTSLLQTSIQHTAHLYCKRVYIILHISTANEYTAYGTSLLQTSRLYTAHHSLRQIYKKFYVYALSQILNIVTIW